MDLAAVGGIRADNDDGSKVTSPQLDLGQSTGYQPVTRRTIHRPREEAPTMFALGLRRAGVALVAESYRPATIFALWCRVKSPAKD